MIWALIDGHAAGWGSVATLARLALGMALLLAIGGYAMSAQLMMSFLPLYLQNAFGYAPIASGAVVLRFALVMALGPGLGARMGLTLPDHNPHHDAPSGIVLAVGIPGVF